MLARALRIALAVLAVAFCVAVWRAVLTLDGRAFLLLYALGMIAMVIGASALTVYAWARRQ
jgi:hypothetical protein